MPLLQNETFKVKFINRFNQLMHTALAYETTHPYNDETTATLRDEIPNQVARFNFPNNLNTWEKHMEGINTFLSQREHFVTQQLQEHFLPNDFSLTIDALYPSPAQSELHILIDLDQTAFTPIQIFGLTGKLQLSLNHIFGQGISEVTIPLHLSPGVYILKVADQSKKFVVID